MDSKETIAVGKSAPDFSLQDHSGNTVTLSQFINEGKYVVVYFYPKDFTSGCTAEACEFRNKFNDFQGQTDSDSSTVILGISPDSPQKHKNFKDHYQLPFILLSDPKGDVFKLFGVDYHLFGLIPGRKTFVIDKNGKFAHIFGSFFNAKAHVEEALKIVTQLKKEESDKKEQVKSKETTETL